MLDKGIVFTYGYYTNGCTKPLTIIMFGYKSTLELSKAFFINLFTFIILFVPRSVATCIANVVGFSAFFVLRGRRRAILEVLRVIQPQANGRLRLHTGWRTLMNYANNFADFLRLYHMEKDELLGITRIEGIERLERALKKYGGAVVISAHLGNWEIGSNFIAACGAPLVGVVESGGPGEAFYRLFKRYRQRFGTNLIALEDPSVGLKLRRYLKNGFVVGLIADRDIAGTGTEVQFFGRRSVFPTGAAFLSLVTNTPIFPSFYLRLQGKGDKVYYGLIEEPIQFKRGEDLREDVGRLTGMIVRCIEEMVRRYPDQWFCFPPPWQGVDKGENGRKGEGERGRGGDERVSA
jgi:lauroyl/myristoyl acyltransferase